jgi:hypothetical protein
MGSGAGKSVLGFSVMTKIIGLGLILFGCSHVWGQNIEGQVIASQYGRWRVPGYSANTYTGFAPTSCRVQGGASFFFAFTVGTPITIVDSNPSMNETLTPTATVESDVTCSVSIAPVNSHQLPFYFASGTGGLQEALSQNLTTPQTNTVILDSSWYSQVGGPSRAATVIAAAQGSTALGLVDVTTVPTTWYAWNGSQYVKVALGGGGGGGGGGGDLGTLVNDLVANNSTNTAAEDLYDFVATGPAVYSPQAAVNAAAANNGSVILQPGVGRTPFTNRGNYRVQDNRADVPATARNVTEFGAACDTRNVYGTLTAGSTAFTIEGGALTSADIGRSLVAALTTANPPIQFESTVVSITDSLHGVLTTAAPASQAVAHEMDLAHDDTAAIAQGMNAVSSGGTLVFPEGACLTHTQSLKGQSPIGLGINSQIVGFPGEDIFQAPDPSQGPGYNQGAAHIHDLTFLVDGRIDATQPWQTINDSGTTAHAAMYRPLAPLSGVANNPLAPGWFIGGYNGVANITAGSAVMCVPTAETAPSVGQTVVFPYLVSVFTATVSSTAGSCATGAKPRTLASPLPSGSTNAQAEWFAGSAPQNLATAIGSGACPATITLSNPIVPAPGFESNVAPFGLIQIDGEQFTYFARSQAGNPTPANTLYNVQCAQNGTVRSAHASSATVAPLNNFQPTYPWPVIPTVNAKDTTPSGTAGFFPGWNVGNAAFAFPVATGISSGSGSTGAWSANARIENLSFFEWPNEINGESWGSVNHTAMLYFVSPSYASVFSNLYTLYLFYGLANGPPSIENGNYAAAQPTGDGTHYDGLTIYAANPVILSLGNQNTFSNFNVYSDEGSIPGTGLGADTCYYFTALHDDQTGGYFDVLSLDHFKNLYCEPEAGPHTVTMPEWEWDTYNSEIEDQHMGGGGEVYVGGAQQHWIGGNFNNAVTTPLINFGTQNTSEYSTNLGSEPKGNVYGTNSLINWGWGSQWQGSTSQRFSSPFGPYGALQVGNNREPIRAQTNETFNTGNLTVPYSSSEGGFISPEEFNSSFAFESQAMNVGWTYDSTSPVSNAYTACNVGNDPNFTYCATGQFNEENLPIGTGQRLVPGKYTLYISMKDLTASTNAEELQVFSNCASFSKIVSIPMTNAWPLTAAAVFSTPIDFSALTGVGCALGLRFNGATTADQIQVGYMDFAPVAENLIAQNITVTNINMPGGPTGGNSTGCAQSPITGIDGGYTCPTKGSETTLGANQGVSDTTMTVANTSGFSSSGCLFADGEYECYTSAPDSTHFAGITRGAYLTTPSTHNSGAAVVAVPLVLGSLQQSPSVVIAYGGGEAPILSVNNGTPFNYGGAAVFEVNGGNNTTWIDTGGAIHQLNSGAQSNFQGSMTVGLKLAVQPAITQSGYLLQTNGPNTAYAPMSLGGGHAGSLNVIQAPPIGAPLLGGALPSGSSTVSWVCSGTDFDGNLVPGTTTTVTNGPASWTFPSGITVSCPWAAGVNTYQIYRTVGGSSQGLLASGIGPGFSVSDFGGATLGGTPPAANGSSPHISVAGTGTPSIQLGPTNVSTGAGAPTSTCGTAPIGSGSLWLRTDGDASTSLYSCGGTTWTAVTLP